MGGGSSGKAPDKVAEKVLEASGKGSVQKNLPLLKDER